MAIPRSDQQELPRSFRSTSSGFRSWWTMLRVQVQQPTGHLGQVEGHLAHGQDSSACAVDVELEVPPICQAHDQAEV